MQKNFPQIALAVGAVAIVGLFLVARAMSGQSESQQVTNQAEDAAMQGTNPEGATENFTGTIEQLRQLGGNYTCDFSVANQEDNTTVDGTVYVTEAGDKMRGEYSSTLADGSAQQSYMLRSGNEFYMWQAGSSTGIKSTINPELTEVAQQVGEQQAEQTGFDPNQQVTFDCDHWTVDSGMFVPPSNVEFTDFSAQMELMMENLNTNEDVLGDQDQCAVCNQLPEGEARTQCLAALEC